MDIPFSRPSLHVRIQEGQTRNIIENNSIELMVIVYGILYMVIVSSVICLIFEQKRFRAYAAKIIIIVYGHRRDGYAC